MCIAHCRPHNVRQNKYMHKVCIYMYTLVLSYALYNDDGRVEGKARHARQILLVLEKESSGF